VVRDKFTVTLSYRTLIVSFLVKGPGSFESAAVVVLQFGRREQKSTIDWSIRNFYWRWLLIGPRNGISKFVFILELWGRALRLILSTMKMFAPSHWWTFDSLVCVLNCTFYLACCSLESRGGCCEHQVLLCSWIDSFGAQRMQTASADERWLIDSLVLWTLAHRFDMFGVLFLLLWRFSACDYLWSPTKTILGGCQLILDFVSGKYFALQGFLPFLIVCDCSGL
jgi:hypothetical protein